MAEARNLSDFEEMHQAPISMVPNDNHEKKPPQKKKKTSRIKYMGAYIGIAIVTFFSLLSVIHMQNTVTKTSTSIVNQQYKNEQVAEKVEELTQEKSELSRADRIMKIAKEGGLVINDSNIRKVTK